MRPIYKWIIAGIAIIVLACLGSAGYGYKLLKSEVPGYGETIPLPGLERPIEVTFDSWGVPHVFGGSDRDIVRALGYLHARDRLWQMDLVRRAAAGRLSEIFGEVAYDADVFQRVIGLERFAQDAVKSLDSDTIALLQAYSDGVNEFIKTHPEHPTLEFRLLGYKMEPWKPADVVMLGRMTGWTLSANWNEEILRLALLTERGEDAAWALMPRHRDPGPFIIPPEEKKYGQGARKDSRQPNRLAEYDKDTLIRLLNLNHEVRRDFGVFAGSEFASNSWVVAPKKSVTSGAILCNDPHLDLLLPAVWHEAHLVGDSINVAGVAFPGTPFIVLGHTPKIAWGATTTVADTQDLYVLKINPQNPDEYLFNGQYEKFKIAEEKIRIRKQKGLEEKTLKVRISRHGPVITDNLPSIPKNLPPLALRWTGYEKTNEVRAIMNMAKATNWSGFLDALKDLGVPIQNWVYADVEGNIGYIANGLLPIRLKGDGTLPAPGDDPAYEWQGFVPQPEQPQLLNPASGFIATANNKVVPEEDYPYIVSYRYAAPYRAMRITEFLRSKDKLSLDDMAALQMDSKLMAGERLAKYFIGAYEKKGDQSNTKLAAAIEELKKWDFSTPADSVAALFFQEAYRQAFRLTFEDEMSEELFIAFREDRSPWNGFDNGIEEDFALFDDRQTSQVETRDDIFAKALLEAVSELSGTMGEDVSAWVWGKRHTILFNHPFGQVDYMRKLLSKGPYPISGSRDTVNNGFFDWFNNPYVVWEGPSLRHIADMANIENSRFTITVGQSGHRLSPHYADQVQNWLTGEYHPQPMAREGVEKISEGKVKFIP